MLSILTKRLSNHDARLGQDGTMTAACAIFLDSDWIKSRLVSCKQYFSVLTKSLVAMESPDVGEEQKKK